MFSLDEVEEVIRKNKWNCLKSISTGWTNTVKEIVHNDKVYMARFPKTDFFSKRIEMDVFMSNFLSEELHIPTSKMQLMYSNKKPYSLHEKIEGYSLDEALPLNEEQMNKASKKIAKFYHSLHSFNVNKLPQEVQNIKYYDIAINLPKLKDYDMSMFEGILQDIAKEKQVLINGDLTVKNIIVNDNKEITAFIDFAFCSMGDIYSDLSVIGCILIDVNFFHKILQEYSVISGIELDMDKIQNRMKMRNYVNEQYIAYMKEKHKEIQLSTSKREQQPQK